jgi:hypothetical protein
MRWLKHLAPAFSIGILVLLSPGVALAQSCGDSHANCPQDQTCQPGLFGGECRRQPCNANSDCPSARRTCLGGFCQTGCSTSAQCGRGLVCQGAGSLRLGTCVTPPPPQPTPPPGQLPGEGQACGTIILGGGVKKHKGCLKGLKCQNNKCVKLEVELQGAPGKLAGLATFIMLANFSEQASRM